MTQARCIKWAAGKKKLNARLPVFGRDVTLSMFDITACVYTPDVIDEVDSVVVDEAFLARHLAILSLGDHWPGERVVSRDKPRSVEHNERLALPPALCRFFAKQTSAKRTRNRMAPKNCFCRLFSCRIFSNIFSYFFLHIFSIHFSFLFLVSFLSLFSFTVVLAFF